MSDDDYEYYRLDINLCEDEYYHRYIEFIWLYDHHNEFEVIFRGETFEIPERASDKFIRNVINYNCEDDDSIRYTERNYLFGTAMNRSIYLRKLFGFLLYKLPSMSDMMFRAIMKCAFYYIRKDNNYNNNLRMKFVYNFTYASPEYYGSKKKLVNKNYLSEQLLSSLLSEKRVERFGFNYIARMILSIEKWVQLENNE